MPAFLNGILAVGIILISFFVDFRFPVSVGNVKVVGMVMVGMGMGLYAWASVHLKEAIGGRVSPMLDVLIKEGPYRYMRHPVYLGLALALLGVTVSLKNWLGGLLVFLLYFPSEVYRARLEEKALARKFGKEWSDYFQRTGFFIPKFRRK